MCIDTVDFWFGIANGQSSTIFDRVICPRHVDFLFPDDNLSENQCIFTNFDLCIYIVEEWFGIADGKFYQFLSELSARNIISS